MKFETLEFESAILNRISSLNIILGRNGSGKSRFLREIDEQIFRNGDFNTRYISPERAGSFKVDGNIITNQGNDPNFLRNTRSFNQASNFKSGSAMLLRNAELLYLRKITTNPEFRLDLEKTFQNDRLSRINRLLINIQLHIVKDDFEFRTINGEVVRPADISSGESEAVSLASEIIYFFDTIDANKFNILLMDEPDVHLHPDLQARLVRFITEFLDEFENQQEVIAICIATHSAPLVCAAASHHTTSIGTKYFNDKTVELRNASAELKKLSPFFGHPLSLALSDDVPLIVEGEDDERVWQQASRSSQGKIKLFPVQANSIDQMNKIEQLANGLLTSIYDNPVAFSLRDGDGVVNEPIDRLGPVIRYRLNCYSVENLLLTDECLSILGVNWEKIKEAALVWLGSNSNHKGAEIVRQMLVSENRMRHVKIKQIRNLVCSFAGAKKPWEVAVGQSIAQIPVSATASTSMLVDFFGEEGFKAIVHGQLSSFTPSTEA